MSIRNVIFQDRGLSPPSKGEGGGGERSREGPEGEKATEVERSAMQMKEVNFMIRLLR